MATIEGCPISVFLSLASACPNTDVPPCATATPSTLWGAVCCSSLFAYAENLASCYEQHTPACFQPTSVTGSVASASTAAENVCLQYLGGSVPPGSTAAPASTPAGTSVVATVSSAISVASSAASAGSGSITSAASSVASVAGSGTSSAAAVATTSKSAAPKVGAGLKVYLGAALIVALSVLAM